jgi:hypothetical protein
MKLFKRNQVEEAISRTLGHSSLVPSRETRTRIKRLLDADRSLTIKAREDGLNVTNYAFYSADAPGKGVEVAFSNFEAFALQTGLRVLQHGWPQAFVVNALRALRSDLEHQYVRFMKQSPAELFDAKRIEKLSRSSAFPVDNADPVYLTIVSGKAKYGAEIDDQTTAVVCHGMDEVSAAIKNSQAHSWTLIEIVTFARQLADKLSNAQPRARGRS